MKRIIMLSTVILMLAVTLAACKNAVVSSTLTITEKTWSGWTREQPEPVITVYENVVEGTVIYDNPHFGTITVERATDETVVLRIDGSSFVRPNENGTVNLNADPIDSLTVGYGEEREIVTPTLDAGKVILIQYGTAEENE